MIKFGSIEYFTLLDLQSKLKYRAYDKLDLEQLNRLRYEVEVKIKSIELEARKLKDML